MQEHLDTNEAAKYLRLQPNTLNVWRMKGKGPEYLKPESGKILYTKEALDAWLNKGKAQS